MKRCVRFQQHISCATKRFWEMVEIFAPYSFSFLPVVHKKQFQFLGVVDNKLVESVGKQVTGFLVGTCRLISLKFYFKNQFTSVNFPNHSRLTVEELFPWIVGERENQDPLICAMSFCRCGKIVDVDGAQKIWCAFSQFLPWQEGLASSFYKISNTMNGK